MICLQSGDWSGDLGLQPFELESRGPCCRLLMHAESEQVRGFYDHLTPEFERSPTDSQQLLLLLLNDIRRTLGSLPH
jgi:hypothetical protein